MKTMHTPWGPAQTVEVIAEGIIAVTTASHGGIHLSPERYAKMPEEYRTTWAGGPWYEEDCDWAKVALTFPEHFPDCQDAAEKTVAWLNR